MGGATSNTGAIMDSLNIRAHFDGTSIQLDETVDLPTNVPLIVTVSPATDADGLHRDWSHVSGQGLAAAYGDDEPDYSAADVLP